MATPRFLTPQTEPQKRPDPDSPQDHDGMVYTRSILLTRIGVGVAGILLPVGLFVVDLGWLFVGHPSGRDFLAFIVVAAICVYAGVRTWLDGKRLV